jgi:Cft2 family RNA processing exonuclease
MKNIIYLLLILIAQHVKAQDADQEIREQFAEYSQLVIDKKFDEAFNYTIEDLFKIVPKDQMKSLMESIFNMPTIEYRANVPEILEVEPIKKIKGSYYAKIQSKSVIEMKFKQSAEEQKRTVEEEQENNDILLLTFQSKYGIDNVLLDENSGFFKITVFKTAIAKSQDLKNWKFATIDNPRMKSLLESFIPKELLK